MSSPVTTTLENARPLALSRGAQGTPWRVRAHVEHVMGMAISIHIRAVEPDRTDITNAVNDAWHLLHRIDDVFSTWRQDSEVMRLRRGTLAADATNPWIRDVHSLCLRASKASGGLFTTDLIGPDGTRGWDPTGIVKGWAVDQAAQIFQQLPGIAYCINAAGDIYCGRTPRGPVAIWTIGIEDPLTRGIAYTIPMYTGALATSGIGARGHHIIDPRTGAPPATDLTSLTVTGPQLTWADMWATVSWIDPTALQRSKATHASWSAYQVAGSTPQQPLTCWEP